MRRLVRSMACALMFATSAAAFAQASAHRPRAATPAANFLVEWRIRPADAAAARGDVVITSGSAAVGGATGYGPGSVVVGTARVAAPQAVRVANGKEGAIRFDRAESRMVYDMSYAASSSADAVTDPSTTASGATTGGSRSRSRSQDRGVAGHEVVVHRVDGLRVTPHWVSGDKLQLDVQMTHVAPVAEGGDGRTSRGFDVTSTVELAFDDWQPVASVGDNGDELQVRVSWR